MGGVRSLPLFTEQLQCSWYRSAPCTMGVGGIRLGKRKGTQKQLNSSLLSFAP